MKYNKTLWTDIIRDQYGNIIQQGTPASAKNFNNMETAIANLSVEIEANAELVRESTPSGFTTIPELDYAYMSTNPNTIKLKSDAVAYVNGYKTMIPAGTIITLNAPPVTGSREDLIFLECWKESDINGVVSWKWRLRVVDGVDFASYDLDGMSTSAYWWRDDHKILVQGGNSAPLKYDTNIDAMHQLYRHSNLSYRDIKAFGDRGLFIVGKGDQASKDILKTADGYVYAVPMFRINRRNSGGYSVENGNGASLFKQIGIVAPFKSSDNILKVKSTSSINAGSFAFFIDSKCNLVKCARVKSVLDETTLDVQFLYNTWDTVNTVGYVIYFSDRPDLILADTVAERNIKPLWHQISLTGFNTQQLLEENFDKLLRGELQTKEKTQMTKTYHGIRKTPIDANTIFYASFDGSVNAEVGSTVSSSSQLFVPSPTGLALASKSGVFKGSANIIAGKTYTIDFWLSKPQSDATVCLSNEGCSKYLGLCVPGSGSGSDAYYAFYDVDGRPGWDNGSPIPKYTKGHANFNHVRLILNTSTGALKVFVNGKLESNNSIFVKSEHLSYLSQLTQIRVTGDIIVSDLSVSDIDRGDVFATLPRDFIDGYARIAPAFNSQRKVFSDALTSQYTLDIVKASGVNAKQIVVTQKTAGIWTAGDTIKVKGLGGEIVSGVIDSDTALATITSTSSSDKLGVDDVSKIVVNDTINLLSDSGELISVVVTAVDVTNKLITINRSPFNDSWVGHTIFETTASSSSPTVKFNNAGNITAVTGTWSGLGTNEATFTLTATTGLNAQDIQIEYSLNMTAGQGGISEVLTATLAGEYQGKKLVVNPSVHVRDDFAGKEAGSVVECPHVMKYKTDSSSLLSPSSSLFVEVNQDGYDYSSILNNVSASYMIRIAGAIPQLLLQFNIVKIVEDRFGPIPALDKIQWCIDNVAKIIPNVHAYGSCPSGNKLCLELTSNGTDWDSASIVTRTDNVPTLISTFTMNMYRIDKNGVFSIILYTDASDGVTPSQINLDYAYLDIILKTPAGYDILAPENPRRDYGRSNMLLVRKETKEIQAMFPATNTDGVVTYGDYVPYQGLAISSGIIKALDSKVFVTSAGTGAATPSKDMQFNDSLYRLLGNNIPLYQYCNENIALSIGVDLSNNVYLPIVSYWGGKKFANIGSSGADLDVVNMDISKIPNINICAFYAGIKYVNGELYMCLKGIVFKNNRRYLTYIFDFKLQNRPLIK